MVGGGGWWWCLNVKLVIGFGPTLGLGLELRAKPIKKNIFLGPPLVDQLSPRLKHQGPGCGQSLSLNSH